MIGEYDCFPMGVQPSQIPVCQMCGSLVAGDYVMIQRHFRFHNEVEEAKQK
jgi:hypothetical protein